MPLDVSFALIAFDGPIVTHLFRILILTTALVCVPVHAQSPCWHGDAATGELRFSGAIEDERFYGQFKQFEVEVCQPSAEQWTDSEWTVTVETASADTRNRDRDEILHGDAFFAAVDFPAAVWTSRDVNEQAGGLLVEGTLELRGQAVDQAVQVELALNDGVLSMTGLAEILRLDYQVGVGEYADTEFIRNRVDIEFELQLEKRR
ncbi:MAG: YceI family protein [Pseudomonadota bacterium]